MAILSLQTAGESHGPALTALLTGMPAGVPIDLELINRELKRRQGGYGRGGRQRIEQDTVTVLAGVRRGLTTGAPIVLQIPNRDSRLDDAVKTPPLSKPRPGHADLAGSIKWLTTDCRDTLERASARETAARTAAGALCRSLLSQFSIEVFAFLRGALDIESSVEIAPSTWRSLVARRDESEVYCPDPGASAQLIERIHQAKVDKDTVGGLLECHAFNCPIGLGSCVQSELRLDARLAGAVMSIQAIKAVEIGLGRECALRPGSAVHDPILYDPAQRSAPILGFTRPTNNAGGIEGGMTNGMPVVVKATMKPISTLLRGLPSVDLATLRAQQSAYERSDVCAAAAASVVLENVVAFELARALLDKFGGDTLAEVRHAYASYLEAARALPHSTGSASVSASEVEPGEA